MFIAEYEGCKTSVPASEYQIEFADFVEKLIAPATLTDCHPCPGHGACEAKKHTRAWSPVSLKVSRRKNENVESLHALVLDFDSLTAEDTKQLSSLQSSQYEWVVHSTHSHGCTPGEICLRAIFPLSRPVAPSEWHQFRNAAILHLGLNSATISGKPLVDPQDDLARIYFYASTPRGGGVQPIAQHSPGAPLPVDVILLTVGPTSIQKLEQPEELIEIDTSTVEVSRKFIADILRKCPKAQRDLMQKVCKGESFADHHRDDAMQRISSIMAFKLASHGVSVDQMLAFLGPSIVFTPKRKRYHDVESMTEGFREKLTRALAEKIRKDSVAKAGELAIRKYTDSLAGQTSRDPSEELARQVDAIEQAGGDWRDAFRMRRGLSGEEYVDPTSMVNAHLVLEYDPAWTGKITYNQLSKQIELEGTALNKTPGRMNLEDHHVHGVALWLEKEYGLSTKRFIWDVLITIAQERSYNPVEEYLESVRPTWDGVDRLATLFETYFSVSTKNAIGDDIAPFVREAGKRFMLSAAARGYNPGCQADLVLVFEGAQGLFKSQALKVLAKGFFSQTPLDIGSNDSRMQCSKFWIIELAELEALRKSESTSTKAFFSQSTDDYRAPYQRTIKSEPRRCVFIGTSNTGDYLQDDTGNRRYLTFKVQGLLDIEGLRENIDQIWAQTATLYKDDRMVEGFKDLRVNRWWFDPRAPEDEELLKLAHIEAEERTLKDVLQDRIFQAWVSKGAPSEFTLAEAFDFLAIVDVMRGQTTSDQRRLRIALKKLGFNALRHKRNGRQDTYYSPSEQLTEAAKASRASKPLAKPYVVKETSK